MAITKYTVLNFPEKEFIENKQSRCSYPWDTTPVGGGFDIPFADLGTKKSVPTCPDSLKKKGVKYEWAKVDDKQYYLFKRIA